MTLIQSRNGASSLPAPAGAGSEEVVARPTRRRFTAEYKLSILREAEHCMSGELGALLRRGDAREPGGATNRSANGILAQASCAAVRTGPNPVFLVLLLSLSAAVLPLSQAAWVAALG